MKRLHLAVAGWLIAGASAQAHAFLDHADPRVGSTVAGSPSTVRVWMTESLEPNFSRLAVADASGREVDHKDLAVSGETMSVSLPKLPPGIYHVTWKAVATDTHKTTGSFDFTVR